MKNHKKRFIIFLVLFLLICFNYNISLAEYLGKSADNFYGDNTDKKERQDYTKSGKVLTPYTLCLAVSRDDVSVCNNLASKEARACSNFFHEYHIYLRDIILTGEASLRGLVACSQAWKTEKECKAYAEGIIKKDSTVCDSVKDGENKNDCKAIIAQDMPLCGRREACRGNLLYMKAIKSNNIAICGQIRNEYIKAVCYGDVVSDETVCEKCK